MNHINLCLKKSLTQPATGWEVLGSVLLHGFSVIIVTIPCSLNDLTSIKVSKSLQNPRQLVKILVA